MKGEKRGHGQDTALNRATMGISAFFTPGFADFIEYLICSATHPAACPSLSCLALASEHQRCSCISISRWTDPSKETSSWVSLSYSYYPSFLSARLLPLPLSLPLFDSLSLSPSISFTPVILVREALISLLFSFVYCLLLSVHLTRHLIVPPSDCSFLWLLDISVACIYSHSFATCSVFFYYIDVFSNDMCFVVAIMSSLLILCALKFCVYGLHRMCVFNYTFN